MVSFEHAAHVQVFDQGAQALIELAAVIAHEGEVLAMAVPAAEGQGDAADARFHQPAGHQQLIVDRRGTVELELIGLAVAVAFAHRGRLLGDVEGPHQPVGGEHVQGPVLGGVESLHRGVEIDVAAQVVEAGQQRPAIVEAIGGDAVQGHVFQARAVRLERSVGGPEEAGLAGIGPGPVLRRGGQADEGRHRRRRRPLAAG